MGCWRQLQAVSRESCAGEHREGDDHRPSAEDFAEDFHGSTITATWAAAVPPLERFWPAAAQALRRSGPAQRLAQQ